MPDQDNWPQGPELTEPSVTVEFTGSLRSATREEFNAMQVQVERQRLRSAVVEAAKVYVRNRGYGPAERSLRASVDALIAFEAEHVTPLASTPKHD